MLRDPSAYPSSTVPLRMRINGRRKSMGVQGLMVPRSAGYLLGRHGHQVAGFYPDFALLAPAETDADHIEVEALTDDGVLALVCDATEGRPLSATVTRTQAAIPGVLRGCGDGDVQYAIESTDHERLIPRAACVGNGCIAGADAPANPTASKEG